jgi:hypothetical protein
MTHWWREVRDFFSLFVRILWRLSVSLAALGFVVVAFWALRRAYTYHFGFDRTQWAASATRQMSDPEAAYDSPREGMVDDVLAHELRPGMSRAAVQAVLGPADRADDLEWYYDAGWRSIDPCTLVITFSAQGTVLHYEAAE